LVIELDEAGVIETGDGDFPSSIRQIDEFVRQARDDGLSAERGETSGARSAVEKAEQTQNSQLNPAFAPFGGRAGCVLVLEPELIGPDDFEGVAVGRIGIVTPHPLGIGLGELKSVALADVAAVFAARDEFEIPAHQRKSQGVAAEFGGGLTQFGVVRFDLRFARPLDAPGVEERGAGLVAELFERFFDAGRASLEIDDRLAGGDDAEARIFPGQTAEQGFERRFRPLPGDGARRMLQGLDAVEEEERFFLGDELGEAFAAGSGVARVRVGIAEPFERGGEEEFGGGGAFAFFAGALAVE
jgi:hypothetical protein